MQAILALPSRRCRIGKMPMPRTQALCRSSASKIRATHVSIDVTSLAIEELPAAIKEDVEDYLENHPRSPAARMRPRMGMVGDIWLAFIGPKVRTGASGLGHTPRGALEDFNRHFMEPIISWNGSGLN